MDEEEKIAVEPVDLTRYFTAAQAADMISRNSGRTIPPSYMHTLKDYGAIQAVKVGGRYWYEKTSVRKYRVEARGVKVNKRWKKALAKRQQKEEQPPLLAAFA